MKKLAKDHTAGEWLSRDDKQVSLTLLSAGRGWQVPWGQEIWGSEVWAWLSLRVQGLGVLIGV